VTQLDLDTPNAPAVAPEPFKARFDRRVLKPAIRAEVFGYEGLFEVRTGMRRIGPMSRHDADTSAYVHNAQHGHDADQLMTDRRRATATASNQAGRATAAPRTLDVEVTAALSQAATGNTDALIEQVTRASLRSASRSIQRVADIETALGNHYLARDATQALALVADLEAKVTL